MAKYITKQVLYGILKLFIVLLITFLLIKLMKIDVVNPKSPKAVQDSIRHQLGLDLPLWTQFFNFIKNAFTLNFGNSWKLEEGVPVMQMIGEKLPYSLTLGVSAYIVSIIVGFFNGTFLAKNIGKRSDTLGTLFMLLIASVPTFVIGSLIQLLGSYINLPTVFEGENAISWFLPILVLTIGMSSGFTKSFRFFLVDVYTQEYITTARAKGLSESEVLRKHARRNALVPMLEPIVAGLLGLIAGTVSIEKLFNIPGIGNLLLNAVNSADQPVILAMVFILTTIAIVSMTIVNILYTFVDPRIKLGE